MRLLEDLENDPWGRPYKMFTKKKPMSCTLMETDAEKIAQDLFPTHHSVSWTKKHCKDPPLFTLEELNAANGKTKTGKAPGPDGISPEVTKAIISEHPEECLEIYYRCLIQQSFPSCWKAASQREHGKVQTDLPPGLFRKSSRAHPEFPNRSRNFALG